MEEYNQKKKGSSEFTPHAHMAWVHGSKCRTKERLTSCNDL